MMPDIAGKRYGRLVAIEQACTAKWRFQCDCGKETIALVSNVRRGKTRSCGCGRGKFTHGMSSAPEYAVWEGIIRRCDNPTSGNYQRYGGRGITVCDRWRSFENFFADMGIRPSDLHSIDRIDNDGNYEPGNCRWITRKEQQRNRRVNRVVDYDGRRMTLVEAAELAGIKYGTVAARLCRGWSPERALCTSV